jgi:hypothetical protein
MAAATLNNILKDVLDAQFNNRVVMAAVPDTGTLMPNRNDNAAKSIHVPSYTDAANAFTEDSRITITTLLNQWDVYTKDHQAGANAGILTGLTNDGNAADTGLNAYLFAFIFGGRQEALNALTAISTVGGAALGTFPNVFTDEIAKLNDDPSWEGPPIGGAAPGAAPQAWITGWSGLLNRIAGYFPNARKDCGANETYAAANAGNAPAVDNAAAAAIPPADLIRYAFGLLYKIKVVLGSQWPETHRQLSMGGGKKKSSRYTHRRKQYSQRRYKK